MYKPKGGVVMPVYSRDSALRGVGSTSGEAITAWLNHRGQQMAARFAPDGKFQPVVSNFGHIIIQECGRYPDHQLNWDLVAAQVSHETAAWQSEYARERNNPGGIGAINSDPDQALWFDSVEDGIRAHVAHLLNYIVGKGPWSADDPRGLPDSFYGIVVALSALEQRWAWSPPAQYAATPLAKRYGGMIASHANALVDFANNGTWGQPMPEKRVPEPPFIRTHRSPNKDGYDQPRRIRAIVDHISGGPLASNLSWLTNPNSGASSNVLIAKNGDIYLLVDPSSSPWTNGPMKKPNTAKAIIREWFDKKINPNTQTFTIEHEGHDTDVLTAAQMKSSAWVHAWVAETYGVPLNRDYVLGHYEIDSVGRSYCPSFSEQEWNAIIDGAKRLLEGGNQPSPQPSDDWPKVPPAVPDPRKDNPFGAFWIPKAFITPMAVTPLSVSGYVMSPAFAWTNPDGEVLIVQFTERQRYELHRDGSVTLGRLGAEAMERNR